MCPRVIVVLPARCTLRHPGRARRRSPPGTCGRPTSVTGLPFCPGGAATAGGVTSANARPLAPRSLDHDGRGGLPAAIPHRRKTSGAKWRRVGRRDRALPHPVATPLGHAGGLGHRALGLRLLSGPGPGWGPLAAGPSRRVAPGSQHLVAGLMVAALVAWSFLLGARRCGGRPPCSLATPRWSSLLS